MLEDRKSTSNTETAKLGFSGIDSRSMLFEVFERANKIARSATLEELLDHMLNLMIEVSDAESAIFFIFDRKTNELVISSVVGDVDSVGLIGLRLNKNVGILGDAIAGSQPVIIGDLPDDPRWLRVIYPIQAARLKNVITFPLALEGNPVGVIQIFNYLQVDFDLLRAIGERLVVEIDRLLTVSRVVSSNQRLQSLIDILGQIAGTLDREQLLQMVTEQASKVVDSEQSSVFLVNAHTNDLNYKVSYKSPVSEAEIEQDSDRSKIFNNISQICVLGRETPGRIRSIRSQVPGQFNFISRSAITVPLQSGPISLATSRGERISPHGGLMVLNKNNGNFTDEDASLLGILANQASTFLEVADLYEQSKDLFLGLIEALAAAIDAKDTYTNGHSARVSEYSVAIAEVLGLDGDTVWDVQIGSLLHDVGKIGIPDNILKKPGSLTEAEYEQMKQHPSVGKNIIGQVSMLKDVLPAISEHHERLDGSGYPLALAGDQVSQLGRIVAVADVFDAMASERPYRPAIPVGTVLSYLNENAGVLFDSDCVRALFKALESGMLKIPQA